MIKIRCIGVGQGGVNMAEQFAKRGIITIAVDTAFQNLKNCKHIKENLRIHSKINEHGGAGKAIDQGEMAISKYSQQIKDVIQLEFGKDNTIVYITVGLGGGTGTLGCVQISRALSQLGIEHGIIATLPAEFEGTDETVNAYTGLYAVETLRRKSSNLKSIILIENQKLRSKVKKEYDVEFEGTWEKANEFFVDLLLKPFNLTQVNSSFTVDGKDLEKIIKKDGYTIIGRTVISNISEKTENALFPEVKNTWENGIFVENEYNRGKGLAVMLNRPKSITEDGTIIENLLIQMEGFIGSGTFAHGIYKDKENWKDKINLLEDKPLEVLTVLSGMPFPTKKFQELKKAAEGAIQEYKEKEGDPDIDFNLGLIKSYMDGETTCEDIEFSIFQKEEKIEKVQPIDWKKNKLAKGNK